MFRILILKILVFIPMISFGRSVTIDSQIFYKGQKMGAPRIINSAGRSSKIVLVDPKTKKKFNVELTTTKLRSDLYNINYSLIMKENGNETFNRGSFRISKNGMAKVHLDHSQIVMNFEVE